jgi:phosphoribosylaminoimidazole-succinocarboxamide synthase
MASPGLHPIVWETNIAGAKLLARGKVRDIYDLGDRLLLVASDRLSAFDVVLPTPIPDKGRVLTQLSLFWFNTLSDVVPNHVISATEFPREFDAYRSQLAGRSMLVRRTEPFLVECVVRGYLAGSGWKEYQKSSSVCGIPLPPGLVESARLPEPIFTPATKAETGHDENISFSEMVRQVGRERSEQLREVSIDLYRRAAEFAEQRGILIADTKFEFGLIDDQLIWIDEALTPDSSRFWPADSYMPGSSQPSFDKQFVRDYLERIQWPKTPPGPDLPDDVVAATTAKYRDVYRRLTGNDLS